MHVYVQPEFAGHIEFGQSAQLARVVVQPDALEIGADAEQVAGLTEAQGSRVVPRQVIWRVALVQTLEAFANLYSPAIARNNGGSPAARAL